MLTSSSQNTSGALVAAASGLYVAGIPLTSWLAQPGGMLEKLTNAIVRTITGNSTTDRAVPALAALYLFWTFGVSGACSAAGQAMARQEGLDSSAPRQYLNQMRGLPLRLFSAHSNLMETFPSFAVAAALTQALAPNNQVLVNLLGFHVIAKVFVFYPMYLLDVPPPRTFSHIFGISSVLNVCWQLARGAS